MTRMRVTAHSDPKLFSALARPLLMRNEALNCMALGLLDTLVSEPDRYSGCHLLSMDGEAGLVPSVSARAIWCAASVTSPRRVDNGGVTAPTLPSDRPA